MSNNELNILEVKMYEKPTTAALKHTYDTSNLVIPGQQNAQPQQTVSSTGNTVSLPLNIQQSTDTPEASCTAQEKIEPVEPVNANHDDFSHVTNADFIAAVFQNLPDDASVAVCSKAGDPTEGGWSASRADSCIEKMLAGNNNYVSCSSFSPCVDGNFNVKKSQFFAYHFISLDDLGTKIPLESLADFELSFRIETSPGNYQGGIILAEPITDVEAAERLQKAVISAGLCDEGATGLTRWARLPEAINGKEKYRDEKGSPFRCRLVEWRADQRYTVQEIVDGLKLKVEAKKEVPANDQRNQTLEGDNVLTPRAVENPVVTELKARGLYKTPLGSGKHDMTCPWKDQHTDGLDTGAAYFEPDDVYPVGGFCCQHSHREKYHIRELLDYLGVENAQAKNKPVIRIVAGDLHRVVDAAERELANRNKYYQSGGLIVSVMTDGTTGDPSIVPINIPKLTRELSVAATWEKFDGRSQGWVPSDPPPRHTSILYDSKNFRYLPPLTGVARQPYVREVDGQLVYLPGYDAVSKRFGVFDPKQFPQGDTTLEAAQAALGLLRNLLSEFSFVKPIDESAALSAIFTAVVRVSLNVAPAFHAHASVFASGKSYLCELIAAFAGPGFSEKISYPTTSEEATKVILALLMKNPACVEFDDMDTDWQPHGVIKRMLTAEQISDRILGYSKTATVSTRTLFLGSGNNVGPIRDLLRRVVTIHLDPRVETPATLAYQGDPVADVRANRGKFVMAVMAIIQAWREAGMPRSSVESIATFDGQWSGNCRHPLIWLGLPDPARVLIEQVTHDPDRDVLKSLMTVWLNAFRSTPTTVRKAVEAAVTGGYSDLLDALREFPIEERGHINHSKLGWMLKKNANRIVGGMEFQKAEADGRTAWRVVEVNSRGTAGSPDSPSSPPLPSQIADVTIPKATF